MTTKPIYRIEIKRLQAENAKLRELKTPATRQLLNITKGALDNAEAECVKLRAALKRIRKAVGNDALKSDIDDIASAALEETK